MRIAVIEAVLVDIPMKRAVSGVHGTTASQRSALVRVASDDGAEGWGNVDPTPGYSLVSAETVVQTVRQLAPVLIGRDPFNVLGALAAIDEKSPDCLEARAAVEMALLDLKGRALGVAVHSLLGGRIKDVITFNAWIGTVPPAQAAREALAWLERGFATAKIKVAGASPEGVERVAAVRQAVGPRMALRVDFNESLGADEAVDAIRRLRPFDPSLVEQPVPRHDVGALARIRRAVDVPIMADEAVGDPASLIEIIRREAADIVKLKVMKQGGLGRTCQMIQCAAAGGLRVVIGHGFGLTLSTLAEAAVAATSEAVMDGCEAVGPLKMAADVVEAPLELSGGAMTLSDAPGLGARVDPLALERYRMR